MVKEENFRKAQIDMAVVEFSEQMAIENPGMYRRMTQDGAASDDHCTFRQNFLHRLGRELPI